MSTSFLQHCEKRTSLLAEGFMVESGEGVHVQKKLWLGGLHPLYLMCSIANGPYMRQTQSHH
eukprot:c40161_g1_i1 orf=1-183(-)